ncbi:preprotein translocase subunit SecY [Candidatus Dependentiae bacterium]|nr:preprotein translocase subunit SecY [Candidatus Dependentiae bacterium]
MVVLLRNFKNVFYVEELRKKLFYTLMVFLVYRLGVHITMPGVDLVALKSFFSGATSGMLWYLNMFSGGALQYFSIFALGMSPYISASIMMQLLTIMVPSLEQLSKDGEYGRRIIGQYTRYLTILISLVQGLSMVMYIEKQPGLIIAPGWEFRLVSVFLMMVGSLFVMWLGEQVNAHGLGNGSSMIIFAGIVAGLPSAALRLIENIRLGQTDPLIALVFVLFALAVVSCVIFLEKGERKVPVQYAKRVIGNKLYGGQTSFIPLKLNPSGVVPVIFAGAILGMPVTLAGMIVSRWPSINNIVNTWFSYNSAFYNVLNAGLIVFFAFFYTAIIFNPVELADNLRKSGGFVPGIRPGARTAQFFDYLLTRIGFPGALYLAILAIVPSLLSGSVFPIMFSGTSLLIVIGVGLDTSAQIESHLIERKYEGFLSTGRLKGRWSR